MSPRHLKLTICGAALIGLASAFQPAGAQQPVGLLHGLDSSPETWHYTAMDLKNLLGLDTIVPALDWTSHYADQSTSLIGLLPTNTILVGHSNGGVVARMRAGDQALAGVLTWATPNAGAPMAYNYPFLSLYAGRTAVDANDLVFALTSYESGFYALDALAAPIDYVIESLFNAVGGVADVLGYWYAPVLNDMVPGSPFQADVLNSNAHIAEELGNAPRIVSASFTPESWYYGGMMKLVSYQNSDYVTGIVYDLGYGSLDWAWQLDQDRDPNMDDDEYWALLDAEDALRWFAWDLLGFDAEWCSLVTDNYASGPDDCRPNDELVPEASADLQWAFTAHHFPGLAHVHNQVTNDSQDLRQVLQVDFGVP